MQSAKVFVEIFSQMASNLRKSRKFRPTKYKHYTVCVQILHVRKATSVEKHLQKHKFNFQQVMKILIYIYILIILSMVVIQ